MGQPGAVRLFFTLKKCPRGKNLRSPHLCVCVCVCVCVCGGIRSSVAGCCVDWCWVPAMLRGLVPFLPSHLPPPPTCARCHGAGRPWLWSTAPCRYALRSLSSSCITLTESARKHTQNVPARTRARRAQDSQPRSHRPRRLAAQEGPRGERVRAQGRRGAPAEFFKSRSGP
jgi:hypothetical protein